MKMNRILIVDDKEENIYLLRALLEGNRYEVVTALNGAEALTLARKNPPDLIVSDILMPVMDGFALCREWKKDNVLKSIPFIFYTATYTDERDREFAISLGAEEFIIKPQEPDVFMEVVRKIMQRPAKAPKEPPASTSEMPEQPATKKTEKDMVYLKQYNEVLVRKLETKMEQLDRTNRELESDIIQCKKVESLLQQEKEKVQKYFDAAAVMMLVIAPDGKIENINEKGCEVFSVSKKEILGSNLFDNFIPESSRNDVRLVFNRILHGEEGLMGYYESLAMSKDGSEMVVAWHSTPLKDLIRNTASILISGEDITERKRTEEEILLKTVLLEGQSEMGLDGILIVDDAGEQIFRNKKFDDMWDIPADIVFSKRDDIMLQNVLKQLKDPDSFMKKVKYLYENKNEKSRDEIEFKDGRVFDRYSSPLVDSTDIYRGRIWYFRDITESKTAQEKVRTAYEELKAAQHQLIRSERMAAIGTLSAGIVHEVRNPISIILSCTEFLTFKLSRSEAEVISTVGKIKEASLRANGVLESLLKFARPGEFKTERIDVKSIVAPIMDLVSVQARIANISITADFDDGSIVVDVIKNEIQQVVFNIIKNAIEAMKDGGSMSIKTYSSDDPELLRGKRALVIEITDTGHGISEEDMAKMYVPFFTTKKEMAGTGLGLTICKSITENHNGRLIITSIVGKGTIAKIVLPVVL